MSQDANAEHGHHGPPLSTYYTVFGILIVLTMVTIGVGQITSLPGGVTLAAAMIISSAKAYLVCRYFMLLGYTDRFYTFILILSLFILGLMFLFTSVDWGTRNEVNPGLGDAHSYLQILLERTLG